MIVVMESDADAASDGTGSMLAPGLYWGVRASFVDYVVGNPDGEVYGDDGVETDGTGVFRFPLRSAQRDGDSWRLDFAGDLRFRAHFGALDVTLARPRVELEGSAGTLSVAVGDAHVPIARVRARPPAEIGGSWLVFPPLPVLLTAEGVALFGDAYAVAEEFDSLRIAIPLLSVTTPAGVGE